MSPPATRSVTRIERIEGNKDYALYHLDCSHVVRRRYRSTKRLAICQHCEREGITIIEDAEEL